MRANYLSLLLVLLMGILPFDMQASESDNLRASGRIRKLQY